MASIVELVICTVFTIILYAMPSEQTACTGPTTTWQFPTVMRESTAPNIETPSSKEDADDTVAPLPLKKPSAAVYPLSAGRIRKPFSRSAQKRQSVQMLGSIEHLQHHFSKIGLTSKKPLSSKLAALPAIGPSSQSPPHSPTTSSTLILPPSPARPSPVPGPAYLLAPPVKINPEALRRNAVRSLETVVKLWDLPRDEVASRMEPRPTEILEVLLSTVSAIRAVRSYSLALPSSTFNRSAPSSGFPTIPNRQNISTSSRPSLRAVAGDARSSTASESEKDPLAEVRKAALEVLGSLRTLEEKCRIMGSNKLPEEELLDTPDLASTLQAGTSSVGETSSNPTEEENFTYDDEAEYYDGVNFGADPQEDRKSWEEKLASGEEGWLYRSNVDLASEFQEERAGVRRYLEIVEDVLFGAGDVYVEQRNDWVWQDGDILTSEATSLSRRRSAQDDCEGWMQGDWKDKDMERLHEFLLAHLPLSLQILIPQIAPSGDATDFLARLSDGYLIALAFNAAIERSEKPWGQISGADIHDTLEVQQKESEGQDWTFRRSENLIRFAAALRHRYNIPVHIPTSALSGVDPLFLPAHPTSAKTDSVRRVSGQRPSAFRERNTEVDRILFDPLVVAKKDTGWEECLRRVLLPWLFEVLRERQDV